MQANHLLAAARNCFGAGPLERSAARRQDPVWLAQTFCEPRTRLVPVVESRLLFSATYQPVYVSPAELAPFGLSWEEAVFLGEEPQASYFAVDLSEHAALQQALLSAGAFLELKPHAARLSGTDAARLAYARAMLHWHRTHRFCGRCGAMTRPVLGGHVRRCSAEACGAELFPRTDPAIIVLVGCGERILLARHPQWEVKSFATLAGFVEPGESLEAAVVREVSEEVGLRLCRVCYHSSQPWPFPGTLMVGFVAEAETEEVRLDPEEVAEVRWLTRQEVERQRSRGELVLPPEVSISWRLIEDWLQGSAVAT